MARWNAQRFNNRTAGVARRSVRQRHCVKSTVWQFAGKAAANGRQYNGVKEKAGGRQVARSAWCNALVGCVSVRYAARSQRQALPNRTNRVKPSANRYHRHAGVKRRFTAPCAAVRRTRARRVVWSKRRGNGRCRMRNRRVHIHHAMCRARVVVAVRVAVWRGRQVGGSAVKKAAMKSNAVQGAVTVVVRRSGECGKRGAARVRACSRRRNKMPSSIDKRIRTSEPSRNKQSSVSTR